MKEGKTKLVSSSVLDPEENEYVEEYWVKKAQASLYGRVAKGQLKTLSLFQDDKGIFRVGDRIDPNLVSNDERHAALPATIQSLVIDAPNS